MKIKSIINTIILVLLLCVTLLAEAAPITKVRTSVSNARTRIVLDSAAPVKFTTEKSGTVITVTLPESSAVKQSPKLADAAISSVQLAPVNKKSSQLTIKLKKDAQYKVYQLANPHRLVVDIYKINLVNRTQKIATGVNYTYKQDEMNGLQVQAYVVEVAPSAPYELQPFSAAGTYNGRGSLRSTAAKQNIPVAINASYFDTDGWVIGSIRNKGVMMAADSQPRSGYVLQNGQAKIAQDIAYGATVQISGTRKLLIKGMNRARIAEDLVLYNTFYAPTTKTNAFGHEVKIKNGMVVETSSKGNMKITADSYILSGHGANAAALKTLRVGDHVQLVESLNSGAAERAQTVVSGGPLLVENGRANVRSTQEKMAADIARGRAPRTALGIKKDGTLLLVVVDGRSSSSAGMTLPELAQYMLRLGAVDAVNYDGGGSSEMVINGSIVNNPSDGRERAVSIGLGLLPKR